MTTKAKMKSQPETPQLPKRDNFGMKGEFKLFGGSLSDDFNVLLLNQATNSLWTAHSDEGTRKSQSIAAAAAMTGAKPTDELEGMLVAQMVAAHSAAMECYRRAMLPDQTFAGRESNLRHAVKLSRAYADLLLALDKHRGKGQQRVTVEHVHVHQGGQAIVGAVHQGGGATSKPEGQPYAITHAPGEAMPSDLETVGEAVPVPSR